jgi:hypothetical protein
MMRGDMLHHFSELTAREAAGFGGTKAQRCHGRKEAAAPWIRQTGPAAIHPLEMGDAHQRPYPVRQYMYFRHRSGSNALPNRKQIVQNSRRFNLGGVRCKV